MEKIALWGAAGATGKSLAAALHAHALPYRVVGRRRERLQAAFGHDSLAEIAVWDQHDPASIIAAASGIDTIIFMVGLPYNHNELYPALTRAVVDGAVAAGVKRIVLLGTVYPYGIPEHATVTENHPRAATTFKGRMRKEQEDILLRAHAEGRIQATILRLPDFYGPDVEASFLHRVFKAALDGRTADMIGPIDRPHEFVFVPDIGPVALKLAQTPQAYGRWWNFAGAGTTTQAEAAKAIFALAGRKPKLRVIGKTGLRILGLFDPVMREFVEMHYLQTIPVLMDDAALTALIGPLEKTPYAEGIRRTYEHTQAMSMTRSAA